MMTKRTIWLLLALVAALTACTKLNLGGNPPPTSSPSTSPSSSPTLPPSACQTPNPNTSGNLVIVAMAGAIGATSVPTYGPIAGYGVYNGTTPTTAAVIDSYVNPAGTPTPITTKTILQFENVDQYQVHSAVGFPGDAFPARPYKFSKAQRSPSPNTTIGGSGGWWTGLIPNTYSGTCYSQTFTLKAGTFYFGDYSYYNITTFRDVLVVGTPKPQSVHRIFPNRRRNQAHVR